jgi:tRNA(fMet)-specific endonuclease VapC
MLRFMLDTNICIHVIRTFPPGLRHRFEQTAGSLCISAITLGELHFGAENSARRKENTEEIALFSQRIEVLDFDAAAAREYGRLRAHLQRAGTPVGIHDMLIGAHALSEGLTIVTNNRREFDRMPGLVAESWL